MDKASCHCGNIQIKIEQKVDTLNRCNCSICRRYAALWGFHTCKQVTIEATSSAINRYIWGDEMIEFCFCSSCGCVTHYKTLAKAKTDRLAVNYRMFDHVVYQELPINEIDGASW